MMHSVIQADLKPVAIILPQPLESWITTVGHHTQFPFKFPIHTSVRGEKDEWKKNQLETKQNDV